MWLLMSPFFVARLCSVSSVLRKTLRTCHEGTQEKHDIVGSKEKREFCMHLLDFATDYIKIMRQLFTKPLQQKYGHQRKLNYTSIPSAFSLETKLNLLLKHWNCRLTSWVGHVLSIQFEDNYMVWSEANYYSWHLAKKVMFNCIIQPINSWIKITRKITFIALAVQ